MNSPSQTNPKPCTHRHHSCNSPCSQHHHPLHNSLFHPCFRLLSPNPSHQSHSFPFPPHPQSPINSFPHFHCHHRHAVPYHLCRFSLLSSPPSVVHSSNGKQQNTNDAEVEDSVYKESADAQNGMQELEDEEEDEEGDPVFVLTDEWLEFFAKSEAKRQQDKKMKQKNSRHQQKGKGQIQS